MSGGSFPAGLRLERLRGEHARGDFHSGASAVDQWLSTKALQHQEKHLSATQVLVDSGNQIIGYYTLAADQVNFSEFPLGLAKRLPKRTLPVALLAWFGIDQRHQRRGFGRRLLGQALHDCFVAGQSLPFVAVVLDAIDESTRAFYRHWSFAELQGNPARMYLGTSTLSALIQLK